METGLTGTRFFCSWSGGKDSALAFHQAIRSGGIPQSIITMMTETGMRSRSHGLRRELLEQQAEAIGVPVHFTPTTWDEYEERFRDAVRSEVADSARVGVFGDIDNESHREWDISICSRAGAEAVLPLWQRERSALMQELTDYGFKAVVVAVKDGLLPVQALGRMIDSEMLQLFAEAGVDISGENGEYHTVVIDGPIFQFPLEIAFGETVLRDGVWFIDIETR